MKSLGRIKEAFDDYSKAIEINPQDADAYKHRGWDSLNYYLGTALIALGMIEEAIDDYSKAIKINPECAIAYNNRGLCSLINF